MLPSDLNLPPAFTGFRPDQVETAFSILTSPLPYHIIKAATGKGKSLINVLAHLLAYRLSRASNGSHRSLYLTHNKGLMDQLQTDFSSCNMFMIRGANNYKCPKHGTCERGAVAECKLRYGTNSSCPYTCAKHRAQNESLVNSNYAYCLALSSNDDNLGKFDACIMDEAHELLDVLTNYATIRVSFDDIKQYLSDVSIHLMEKSIEKSIESMAEWGSHWLPTFRSFYLAMRKSASPSELIQMERFGKSLRELSDIKAGKEWENWIIQGDENSMGLIPIWPRRHAHKLLFSQFKKVILSSATFNPQSASYLGIDPSPKTSTNFIELPSSFPLPNRPFYFIPRAPIDWKLRENELIQLMRYIDRNYLTPRLAHRIIIHSRSYEWARRIIAASQPELRQYMITHKPGETRQFAERFFSTPAPVIAVTPDMHTGYDLKDDRARYQLIWKCPTMDARDALTKARVKSEPTYKPNEEAKDLEQTYGRLVRSDKDWGETVSFDSNFGNWFLKSIRPYCSREFVAAWKFTKEVPQPMTGGIN